MELYAIYASTDYEGTSIDSIYQDVDKAMLALIQIMEHMDEYTDLLASNHGIVVDGYVSYYIASVPVNAGPGSADRHANRVSLDYNSIIEEAMKSRDQEKYQGYEEEMHKKYRTSGLRRNNEEPDEHTCARCYMPVPRSQYLCDKHQKMEHERIEQEIKEEEEKNRKKSYESNSVKIFNRYWNSKKS